MAIEATLGLKPKPKRTSLGYEHGEMAGWLASASKIKRLLAGIKHLRCEALQPLRNRPLTWRLESARGRRPIPAERPGLSRAATRVAVMHQCKADLRAKPDRFPSRCLKLAGVETACKPPLGGCIRLTA